MTLGIIRIGWGFISRPFTCDPGDRGVVWALYLFALVLAGLVGCYLGHLVPHSSLMDVLAVFTGIAFLIVVFVLGCWGDDGQDVGRKFDSPLDELTDPMSYSDYHGEW